MRRFRDNDSSSDSSDDDELGSAAKRGRTTGWDEAQLGSSPEAAPAARPASHADPEPAGRQPAFAMLRPDDARPHSEDELSTRNKLLEQLVTDKLEGMVQKIICNKKDGSVFSTSRNDNLKGDAIIPPFDPDDRENNVNVWLKKINQLGEIYNWDNAKRSYYMQARLEGAARKWYNRLEDYDRTWVQWQELLKRTFPRSHEFAEMLEELVARKKDTKEPMSKYFYDKLALCHQCKLDDVSAVSCIVRGLPSEIQASAKALKSKCPEDLYCEFLASLESYQGQSNVRPREKEFEDRKKFAGTFVPKSVDRTNTNLPSAAGISTFTLRCYRCHTDGHTVRECPNPDKRLCNTCGRVGHIARFCRSTTDSKINNKVREINIVQDVNEAYFKSVTVNENQLLAYLDTGAQSNIITLTSAKDLKCEIRPTDKLLKGFTGEAIPALGVVRIKMCIDGITVNDEALVTHLSMGRIQLLVGQPIINRHDIALVVQGNNVKLTECNVTTINEIEVESFDQRIDIRCKSQVRIAPNEAALIEITVNGSPVGTFCTLPRYFNFAGHEYVIPSTVMEGTGGVIKVYNLGAKDIEFAAGQVMVRGQCCTEPLSESGSKQVCQILLCLWSKAVVDNAVEPGNGFVPSCINGDAEECNGSVTCCAEIDAGLSDAVASSPKPVDLAVNIGAVGSSALKDEIVGGVRLADIDVGEIGEGELLWLYKTLIQHGSCFASSTKELGLTNLAEMNIKLTTDKPVFRRPYRLPHHELEVVRSKVKDLLDAGIIRESDSEFASPVVLVKKKNGDMRLCVDYRSLNAITVKDRYPLPIIDDELSKLAGNSYFSSCDLTQSYHQVPVAPDSIRKTAFITPDSQYEYLRVPFGLANSPAVFQRLIHKVLAKINIDKDHILAFMDDILIPSTTVPEGIELLNIFLNTLKEANLKLNINKCSFLKTELNYLGHHISNKGVKPGDTKIKAVREFPTPSNVHQIRQFVGLCSFFRKFINNFAIIAKPLTDLTKKNIVWKWEQAQDDAFLELKSKLVSQPVLAIYDRHLVTELHTDASKLGIAGILMQYQSDGELKPVMYFSRVTTREEQNYHSYELETLALVESLKRFRVYVAGLKLKVITDCAAVRHTFVKKDLVPRIARWWLQVQDFDMEIEYRAGDKMRHVDALSRNPVDVQVNVISTEDWFLTVQMQDAKLNNIIEQLRGGDANPDILNNYKINNERLYRITLHGDRLAVPQVARWKLLQKFHDGMGHCGLKRCEEALKAKYWFPKMTKFIKKYVTSCLDCAFRKGHYGKLEGMLHPIPKPDVPMETVHIDHVGPFPKTTRNNQYILVITDAFSKFVIARLTRTLSSAETVRMLRDVFSMFGFPSTIVSDRGLAFCSRYFKDFAVEKKFKQVLNSVSTPRANGQVERVNRTILDGLKVSSEQGTWDVKLPDIVFSINNTRHDTTEQVPFELMFKHKSRVIPDLEESQNNSDIETLRQAASCNVRRKQAKMKRHFDKKRKECKVYKKGDLVLWKNLKSCSETGVNKKLDSSYAGPYKIFKVLGHDRYMIASVKGFRGYKHFSTVVAADSLRPYIGAAGSISDPDNDSEMDTEDLIDLLES